MDEKQDSENSVSIADRKQDMEKYPGFFNFYWDEKEGKIWLEIDKWDTEFLLLDSLPAGLGSNDVGLDRNQLGTTRIVKFHRIGPKALLIQSNYGYRAISDNPQEVAAVEDAFAQSVVWAFEIQSEENSLPLVDATEFFLRDAKNVVKRLKDREQGDFEYDPDRSAIWMPRTKNFPLNTEVEAILTFRGKEPGEHVKSVAADPFVVTIRQHHSLIQLPEEGFKTRKYDPRASFFGLVYNDYATPVDESLDKRYLVRFRLKKKEPKAKISEAVKPIVFYVDPAIPEPIRSAVVEGAKWWNQAFEAAGYKDAYQVKMLPDDADPLDIRYNMINWVHRSTRGWSYGMVVRDPRTGEIMKGHVSLGSLRIRQDFLIAEGLIANYEDEDSSRMLEMALARIRQLSVHEVGHTLGLGHNYCSHINGRSSVMDYPAMWVKIDENGDLDISDAYDTGVGEWDKVSIAYGYQDFPEDVDEEKELNGILEDAFNRGLYFAPSQDAGAGSAHPLAASWVNGENAIDELNRMMEVRKIALDNFSEKRIRSGQPMALLEEPLVTTYLFHRFQMDSAASFLGGLYYHHKIRGGVQEDPKFVSGDEQRRALEALLETIHPKNLALKEELLKIITPRPQGYSNRDLFPGRTGLPFDPLGAAETAANLSVSLILHPERSQRLVEYHARDPEVPGLGEVLDVLLEATWRTTHTSRDWNEIQRVVDNVVLYRLVELACNDEVGSQVRALAGLKLWELAEWIMDEVDSLEDEDRKAHLMYAASMINLWFQNPDKVKLTKPLDPPMGPPI